VTGGDASSSLVAANECAGSSVGVGGGRVTDRVPDNAPLMVQM